ncbi:expressed protein, partial [Phakopsora pachyrhizi]
CSLPPTCEDTPVTFSSNSEFESHYRSHHQFVCSGCENQRIFPSQSFLNLHLNECHDPILKLKLQQGQKIFSCFDSNCDKVFRSPKSRRLHLIDFHKYPTTFYFSLPNHGLNDLYKKYGSGVSLLRPTWNPRPDGSKPPLTGETHSEHDVLKQKITDRKDGLRKNYGNIRERLKNDDAVDEVKIKSEAKEEDLLAEAMEKISLVPRKVLLKQRDHQKNQCT